MGPGYTAVDGSDARVDRANPDQRVSGQADGVHRLPRRPDHRARLVAPKAKEILGVEPLELSGGHCPHVSRPHELAELLDAVAGGRC